MIPFFTQTVNIATEYGLEPYQIDYMLIIGTVFDVISRPIFSKLTDYLSIAELTIVWAIVLFVQNVIGFFARGASGFYAMEIMLGIGLGASGLKMVVVTNYLGVDNLSQYLMIEQMIALPLSICIPFGLGYLAQQLVNPSLVYLVCIVGSVLK